MQPSLLRAPRFSKRLFIITLILVALAVSSGSILVVTNAGAPPSIAHPSASASGTDLCTLPPALAWYAGEGNADDMSGQGRHGELQNGATSAPGMVGHGFQFDGVNDFVKLPDNFFPYPASGANSAPFTFDAWFKTTAGGVIFGQQAGDPFGSVGGWVPGIWVGTDGKLHASVFWNNSVGSVITSPSAVNDGVFHHVAVTYDGVTQTLYLDGQPVGSKGHTQNGYASVYKYQLGTGYTAYGWPGGNGGWFSFSGIIDEVSIYEQSLSAHDVAMVHAAGSAGKCGLSDLLSLIVAASPDPILAGGDLTYTITATNRETYDATNVIVMDTLPSSTTFVSASPDCSANGNTVTCLIGTLPAGQSASSTIVVRTTTAGVLTNVAVVTANESDPLAANNTTTTQTAVKAPHVVNSAGDVDDGVCDGSHCSLREAINAANSAPGADVIAFNIPGAGPHVISPSSALPVVTDAVRIDGYTQPDTSPNTLAVGSNAVLQIVISGAHLPSQSFDLLRLAGNGGSTVRGLVIRDMYQALALRGAGGHRVEGCFIGTDGTTNSPGTGTGIDIFAASNLVGGPALASRNVIGGNTGVGVAGSGNTIENNLIGINSAGNSSLGGNGHGVRVSGYNYGGGVWATNTRIINNVVSGNGASGIGVFPNSNGAYAINTTIQGNIVGLNAAGTAALPNGGSGIDVGSSDHWYWENDGGEVTNTIIGGAAPAERNVVSGNRGSGIVFGGEYSDISGVIVRGNYIGTNAAGTSAIGNAGHGIDLGNINGIVIGGAGAGEGNLISGNAMDGVMSGSPSNVALQGNYVGTDAAGKVAVPNSTGMFFGRLGWYAGTDNAVNIQVGGASPPPAVLGTSAGAGNLISGNRSAGIEFFTSGNPTAAIPSPYLRVQGNYIGTDIAGIAAIPNGTGVILHSNTRNVSIGGTGAGQRNVISGNLGSGVRFQARDGVAPSHGKVQGNFIGVGADGAAPLGNGAHGVEINWGARGILVGAAPDAGEEDADAGANVLAHNGGSGFHLFPTGGGFEITLSRNSIFGNGLLGIDLRVCPNGIGGGCIMEPAPYVSANDQDDADGNLTNHPVIASAAISGNSVTITGALNSKPSTTLRLEFFSNSSCDASNSGEGKTYLGSASVTTDGGGDASFSLTFSNPVPSQTVFTATATAPDGNTSEFSSCRAGSVPNNAPNPQGDDATTPEDSAVTINVLVNDSDADGDQLSISGFTQGQHGAVSLNSDGTLTYTPAADYSGPDSFVYTVSDAGGITGTANVNVIITPTNDAPSALDDFATVTEDSGSQPINILANDTTGADAGELLAITEVTQGANGVVTLDGSTLSYAPATNFFGTDTFTYTISDGNGGSDIATVIVTVTQVNDAPMAQDDNYATDEDVALRITAPGIVSNDSDVDGDLVQVDKVTSFPSHGTLGFNGDGSFNYTPNPDFNGTDSFTYVTKDTSLALSGEATVTITVNAVNDAPSAGNDLATVSEDSGAILINVLVNDSTAPDAGETLAITAITQGAHGAVTFDASGVSYMPNANYFGTDAFTYTISDGTGGNATATVNVTITPVNDAPWASDDSAMATEDGSITVAVLANDTDIEGDTLTITGVAQGSHGMVIVNPNGTTTYTPSPNFNGSDVFTYIISDGRGGSATATVSITINSVNDPPAAADDAANTSEDTALNVGVLANDSDLDGDTIFINSATQGQHGVATINVDGTITYMPALNFSGKDSFSYTVSDAHGGSATATVTINVSSVNDLPATVADSGMMYEDGGALNLSVLGNDSDAESVALTLISVTPPAHGTASVNPDGTVSYTPAPDFFGMDTFNYTATDGDGGTGTAVVNVTVSPINDAPTAAADQFSVEEDGTLTTSASGVLLNDVDIDSASIVAMLASTPSNGSLVLNPDGSFLYTPNANFNGADSFTYTASDGSLTSSPVAVTIIVAPAPDAPVLATIGNQTIAEGSLLSFTLNASDPDGETLTLSASGLPPGAIFDTTSKTFFWTPGYEQAGDYMVSFVATDPTGLFATEEIMIRVSDVASNLGPVCSMASPSISEIWPPNHKRTEVVNIFGVTDPDNDPLTITIRQILQDEPTNTLGDGTTWIDGGGINSLQAWVRAERSGTNKVPGNGRVYEIFFEAADGRGKSCTGSVKVSVPHDQGNKKGVAVDDGKRYDSTVSGGPCLNCND